VSARIPVHLVTGHLGAGKTSVLRHLLARRPPTERVGLVVNDFGEARIDQALLGPLVLEQRDIAGSCVCCTAPEGFAATVGALLEHVDRVFVEPTGLARPADLIDTLRRAPFADRIALRPLIVVLDPAQLEVDHPDHEVVDALAVAEVLVVNRTDRASEDALAAVHQHLATVWPGPRVVVQTAFGVVSDDVLAASDGKARALPPGHHHAHDHGVVARSVVRPPEQVFRRDALVAWLSDPRWLRAKGLVRTDEGWLEVQLAGGEVRVAPTAWRQDSRLDLLAREEVDLAAFDTLVAAAAGEGVEVAVPGGGRTFDLAALRSLPGVADAASLFPKRAGAAAFLPAVLAAAGAPAEGSVVVTARDGYVSAPVPIAALAGGLLVFALGDGPLPDTQGGPFRVLVPGEVACANVKAVARIVVR
jgi:G3E family GTPase